VLNHKLEPNTRVHTALSNHARQGPGEGFECPFHASQKHEDRGRWKSTWAPPSGAHQNRKTPSSQLFAVKLPKCLEGPHNTYDRSTNISRLQHRSRSKNRDGHSSTHGLSTHDTRESSSQNARVRKFATVSKRIYHGFLINVPWLKCSILNLITRPKATQKPLHTHAYIPDAYTTYKQMYSKY